MDRKGSSRTDSCIAVIIPTRNRPVLLGELIKNLSLVELKPYITVVVDSSDSISVEETQYTPNHIIFIKAEVKSASVQRNIGIDFLLSSQYSEEIELICFLDDDVLIDSKAIEILANRYIYNDKYSEYVGFGFAIKNTNHRKLNFLYKFLLYLFKLYSYKPGIITKSGHPQSYLDHSFDCDVSWLNGVSFWRSDVLKEYLKNTLVVEYSSYEDVIFSYAVSKKYNLLFASDVYVLNQNELDSQLMSSKQFLYGSYLRYYFVDTNKEFSKFWLLMAQLFRSFAYVTAKNSEISYFLRFRIVVTTWVNLLVASMNGVNGGDFIKSRLN